MGAEIHRHPAHRFSVFGDEPAFAEAACRLEQNFLATCIMSRKAFDLLPEGFTAEHLRHEGHAEIFEAAKAAAAREVPTLWPLVKAAVPHLGGKGGYIDSLIGAYEIADLRGFRGYAEAIMDAAVRHDLAEMGRRIQREALSIGEEGSRPTQAIVAKAAVELDRLIAGQERGRDAVSLADAVDEALEAGRLAHERGNGLSGISVGYRCVDRRLAGMEPGGMYVLAARPGMGKSALALAMAMYAARDEGPVLFISLEMAAREHARRAVSFVSGVPEEALKRGENEGDGALAQAVAKGKAKLSKLPLDIVDQPGLKIGEIRLRIKAAMRKHGELALVVLDHMHIAGREDAAARHGDTQGMAEISRGVKRLAKEFGLPILALAQLSRGVEGRDDKRPNLSDLRQSGGIEEDADVVMMLYRAEYYAKKASGERRPGETDEKYYERSMANKAYAESVAGKAELLFEKVRGGRTGIEELRFDAERVRFHEEERA